MNQEKGLVFTVLAENHGPDHLENEHGLSFFITYGDRNYLLDAGQSGVFARNAEKLGILLSEVHMAVLSHAHYDHGDGFGHFFDRNDTAVVYARKEGLAQDCYSVKKTVEGSIESARYIGLSSELLKDNPKRFCWADRLEEIAPGVWLIPHQTMNLGKIGERTGMYRLRENTLYPDDFAHEQSLVFETEKGLVIFNSCSHGGVANIVEEVRQALPGKGVYAYLGGFHLKAPGQQEGINCSQQEVKELGRSLLNLGIEKIYTGHCTGECGYEILGQVMGEKLSKLCTGMREEI